jgi:predicted small lipoprotein YifL
MKKLIQSVASLVFAVLVLAGCGQKGPLILPGNPSEVRTVPEQEQAETDRDEGSEEERVRIP